MKAYIIKDPKGILYLNTIKELKRDCIDFFLGVEPNQYTWEEWYRFGWRCVKINIEITESEI